MWKNVTIAILAIICVILICILVDWHAKIEALRVILEELKILTKQGLY